MGVHYARITLKEGHACIVDKPLVDSVQARDLRVLGCYQLVPKLHLKIDYITVFKGATLQYGIGGFMMTSLHSSAGVRVPGPAFDTVDH